MVEQKCWTGCRSVQKRIVVFPHTGNSWWRWFVCNDATSIGVFWENGTTELIPINVPLVGLTKWEGAVLAINGLIYAIPRSAPNILVINPGEDLSCCALVDCYCPSPQVRRRLWQDVKMWHKFNNLNVDLSHAEDGFRNSESGISKFEQWELDSGWSSSELMRALCVDLLKRGGVFEVERSAQCDPKSPQGERISLELKRFVKLEGIKPWCGHWRMSWWFSTRLKNEYEYQTSAQCEDCIFLSGRHWFSWQCSVASFCNPWTVSFTVPSKVFCTSMLWLDWHHDWITWRFTSWFHLHNDPHDWSRSHESIENNFLAGLSQSALVISTDSPEPLHKFRAQKRLIDLKDEKCSVRFHIARARQHALSAEQSPMGPIQKPKSQES